MDPKHMERLLSPERRQWQDPEAVLDVLGLRAGMEVADIGSGPGFFTLPMARRVAPGGKVCAVDVAPEMLERLRKRAAEERIDNVETLLSQEGLLPLSDNSMDAALMVNVLHESDDPAILLREVFRVLRPGGAFAVVEWKKDRTGTGPAGPSANIRVAPDELTDLLRQAGFVVASPFHVGDHHYGQSALKAGED